MAAPRMTFRCDRCGNFHLGHASGTRDQMRARAESLRKMSPGANPGKGGT
jgi:hypothetical protein